MSKEIDLKFNERNRQPLYEGKRCTTRDEKKGEPGDWFTVDGQRFVLTHVVEMNVSHIVQSFYELEGFSCSKEFYNELQEIYGEEKVDPFGMLWVHLFVGGGGLAMMQ